MDLIMGMRTANDPYGCHNTLVDKTFGRAYHVVRTVYDHLGKLIYIVQNMEAIHNVSDNLNKQPKQVMVLGVTGALGETVNLTLPLGTQSEEVLAYSVLLGASNGNLYGIESEHFTAQYVNDKLEVYLKATAPVELESASIRWLITQKVQG